MRRETESEKLERAFAEEAARAAESRVFLYAATAQTPWWIVSVLLHGLVIVLAGLVSMTVEWPDERLTTQVVTIWEQPKDLAPLDQPRPDPGAAFEPNNPLAPVSEAGTRDYPPPAIPPEMLQNAVWGERIEIPGPGGEEGGSAQGEPDSLVLWPAQSGFELRPGGGGLGGLELADDLVGIGCPSPGRGGGWGGGDGMGFGTGKGDGMAPWGFTGRKPGKKPMLTKIHNPDGKFRAPVIEDSLYKALRWLASHQEYDGHWDAKRYGAAVKTDTAVTGFALLALLGSGHTERVGEYKDNVRRAVAWLKSKQAADGCIWDAADDGAHHRRIGYPCAIATLAMAEAAGMGNIPDTKAAAQKAIDYCMQVHQAGEGRDKGGWRYAPQEPGDLSVTGWFVMALKSAKVSGLKVPTEAFDGAIRFLDSVEIKDGAGSGYGSASRYKYTAGDEHAQTAHRLTAIGNLVRQFMGWKREELQPSVEWFVNKGGVPDWGANGEKVDLYYWYYGTMCVFHQAGALDHGIGHPLWRRWNEAMKGALIPNQCKHGDDTGSWNPVGEFASEWGRVGQTALSALCLEIYFRYEAV